MKDLKHTNELASHELAPMLNLNRTYILKHANIQNIDLWQYIRDLDKQYNKLDSIQYGQYLFEVLDRLFKDLKLV